MRYKKGKCKDCKKEYFLVCKGLCGQCYERQRKKTPLKRPNKPIRKQSKQSAFQMRRYRRVRDEFLEDNPICQYPGCNSREVTLHHARGRLGAFLTDKRWFRSLCWPHHQEIETNPALAKSLGLSYSRLSKEL